MAEFKLADMKESGGVGAIEDGISVVQRRYMSPRAPRNSHPSFMSKEDLTYTRFRGGGIHAYDPGTNVNVFFVVKK